ncbi:MAG: hypothetical protein ACREUS_06315 [Burkholderiales bacterium]
MRRAYVLTKAGSKACSSRRSGLPAHYRQILGLIRSATGDDEIHAAMRPHPPEQVDSWLDELDTLGFIAVMPSASGTEQGPDERWRLAIR